MKKAKIQEFKNDRWNHLFTIEVDEDTHRISFHHETGIIVCYSGRTICTAYKVYKIKEGQRVVLEE